MSTLTAPAPPTTERPRREVRVAIVGAGFGGIGAAIKLREAGIDDFVLLERAGALAGPGGRTRIRAAPATCPGTCTRTPSP